ncbi:MAG: hypothetical protein KA419_02335 [Acidobacteria bacterium]|nr:hypothetical protein [Acidobacteriota bacterium]
MTTFISRYLDPADRLGEILFALIMCLGFTAAVRLGHQDADSRALLVAIGGCNLSWAFVDGVIYVLTALFERGCRVRLARDVLAAPTEHAALARIDREFDGPLMAILNHRERDQVLHWALEIVRAKGKPPPARMRSEDLLGGVAVSLLIALSTLPVLVPLAVVPTPTLAVRLSNLVALTQMFLLGFWWGRIVGAGPIRVALGLTLLGVSLVAVTVSLGG